MYINPSIPLPEFVHIRDIATRWSVDISYVLQFYGDAQFLFGAHQDHVVIYDREKLLDEVRDEIKNKGGDILGVFKFAENELPKIEATMLWLRRDEVLKMEANNIHKCEQSTLECRTTRSPAPLFGEGFSEKQRETTTLTKYLEHETWTPVWAALLISGLQPPQGCTEIPNGTMGLDNSFHMGNEDSFHHARQVLALWNSREISPQKVRPEEFVAWCKTKNINTDWLRDVERLKNCTDGKILKGAQKPTKNEWSEANLRTLYHESIMAGTTTEKLAAKYGITRQAIEKQIKRAADLHGSRKGTYAQPNATWKAKKE